MKIVFHSPSKTNCVRFLPVFLLMPLLLFSTFVLSGQTTPQLSLADILIGLRSKKVTLNERNTLLTEAVKTRGITFALTPEIERELVNTGAGVELVTAIQQKSPKILVIQTPLPKPEPTATPIPISTPIPTPAPTPLPDAGFYRIRANAHIVKAEYDLAVFDYDKAIELSPNESMAYFYRGDAYEKLGNIQKAVADYQKAVELDAANEPAKNNLRRLHPEQLKDLTKKETDSETKSSKAAEMVELGELNNYAVKLATPIYPDIAQKANTQGKVTVKITFDEEGNVIAAKAVNGYLLLRSPCEEAARKSKFKPARFNNQVVKASGFIIYNFVR